MIDVISDKKSGKSTAPPVEKIFRSLQETRMYTRATVRKTIGYFWENYRKFLGKLSEIFGKTIGYFWDWEMEWNPTKS